jgi:hypothetical protein
MIPPRLSGAASGPVAGMSMDLLDPTSRCPQQAGFLNPNRSKAWRRVRPEPLLKLLDKVLQRNAQCIDPAP